MVRKEGKSELYSLYAHLIAWLACLAAMATVCIVAEMREYDRAQHAPPQQQAERKG